MTNVQPTATVFKTGITSLPTELLQEIIQLLPIDAELTSVGLASKSLFAPYIFRNQDYARRHFKADFGRSGISCVWAFLHSRGIKRHSQQGWPMSVWERIPASYRISIFKEIIRIITCKCDGGPRVDARFWALGHATAAQVMVDLLRSPSFDPSQHKNRSIRWAALSFDIESVRLLLQDPRVDPSACDNEAILSCAFNHAQSTVLLDVLLSDHRIDPKALDNLLIRTAASQKNHGLVCRLLQDPRMDVVVSSEEILREVLINGDATVWEQVLSKPGIDLQAIKQHLYDRTELGDSNVLGIIRVVLQDLRINPGDDDCYILQMAAEYGHGKIVQLLLTDPRVDPSVDTNYAIRNCCTSPDLGDFLSGDNLSVYRHLLADPRVDPSVLDNEAIRTSSRNGLADGVRFLLADLRVDASACDNEAVRMAAREGHVYVIRLLLMDPRVNPAANHNEAIRIAAKNGRADVVQVLLADPRVNPLSGGEESAVMLALKWNHVDVLDLLVLDNRVTPFLASNEEFLRRKREGRINPTSPSFVSNQTSCPMSFQYVFERCVLLILGSDIKVRNAFERGVVEKAAGLFRVLEIDPIKFPGIAFQCIHNNWAHLLAQQ
ncbi:hypothetical protein HDU99_003666 [Rhizoclosmatium hyalinum]|nr:hypothetical protein HDU99_003666 [Rhizoclosmatium hyalinum]